MKKPRILMVDDEKDFCTITHHHLASKINCDMVVRFNGEEGIKALDSETFDVLLVDLNMPGIDGYTVLRHAKKVRPEIIALMITRLDNASEIKAVEDLGATYIAKPVQLNAVRMILERKLEKTGGFDFKKT